MIDLDICSCISLKALPLSSLYICSDTVGLLLKVQNSMTNGLLMETHQAHSSVELLRFIRIYVQVYDVTSFVEEHPGGESIVNNVGADSTKGFFG